MRFALFPRSAKRTTCKTLFSICILVLTALPSFAGKKKHLTELKADANSMSQAFLNKDYKTYAQYAYYKVPSAAEEDKLAKMVADHMVDLEKQKNFIIAMTVGEPGSIVHDGNSLQCIVPLTMEKRIPGANVVSQTSLIAFSFDKGHSWRFMDTGGRDLETIRKQFPVVSAKLRIPPPAQDEFVKSK